MPSEHLDGRWGSSKVLPGRVAAGATFATRLLIFGIVLLLGGYVLQAQNTAGLISGVVQDAQGAVVPNAKVTLTNDAQGAASARQGATSQEGTFVFSPVLAGNYTVTVEAPGFKRFVQSSVVLDVSETWIACNLAGSWFHR
jgi:hypothetical protein